MSWLSENQVTAAVTAAAKKCYEENDPAATIIPFEQVPLEQRRALMDMVLGITWAALESLEDPRWAIFEAGKVAGEAEHAGSQGWDTSGTPTENPYPAPELML